MRPILSLVRLPHSHIDPKWLSTVERAIRTPPREFYEWAADLILSVTGAPGKLACSHSRFLTRSAFERSRFAADAFACQVAAVFVKE